MLRKLHIKNFESHKDTIIEFNNGFNVFTGNSDKGKSSIIRALSAVCYNKWNPDMMRLNEDECIVELTTDNGIVRLIKNIKDKINSYECILFGENENKKICFESIGTTVPEMVFDITGMRELDLGDNKDIPNIMYQLEKHYMLSEINGKSCTSNLIARVFDKVIGLGGMEELISDISSDILSNKKQITKNNEKIDLLRQNMHSDIEINENLNKINNSKKLFDEIDLLKKFYDRIEFYDIEINRLRNRWKMLDNKSMNMDTESIKKNVIYVNNLMNKYIKMSNLYDNYNKNICAIDEYNKNINSVKIVNQKEIDKLKEKCNSLYKIDKLISKYEEKISVLKKIDENIAVFQKEYETSYNELEKIKKENVICPLCGKSF